MEKVLLVIGASSDMGTATIEKVISEYDYVIAHFRHMNEKLQSVCNENKDKVILIQADLSVDEEVLELIEKVKESNLTPTHIIHFPAPLCMNQRFNKIKWDVFQKEFDISVKSIVLILQQFLPIMAKNRFGRVILMLSFVIESAPAYCSNYVVTKYALFGLVKSLASEYASKGITVNGISPAWVDTKYISNQPDVLVEQNISASPIGRILNVNDIVPTIEYLLSEGASCVNGQNISITGGR